jgi:hypothetical protein
MRLFRRREHESSLAPREVDPVPLAGVDRDPFLLYADTVTLVVRHSPEQFEIDPSYDTATVTRLAIGADAPVEEMREDVLRWLIDKAKYVGHTEYATRRRQFNAGASGAEAEITLSLLGGAVGGVAATLTQDALRFIRERLGERTEHAHTLDSHLEDVEGIKFAVSRAFGIRLTDLELVEHRATDTHTSAVFKDPAKRYYGADVESGQLVIRRLQAYE